MTRVQLLAFRLLWLSLFILLCNTAFGQGPSSERPLSDFLTENGTFQNPHNFSGSLNPEGFTLSVSDDGTPVFMNSGNASNDNWTLESVIPGTNDQVTSLLVYDGYLYIAGEFSKVGEISAEHIARYNFNTKQWSSLGDGLDSNSSAYTVFSMAAAGDFLYVGGSLHSAGDKTVNGIARYDLNEDLGNESWSTLGSGLQYNGNKGTVYELLISNNILYVAGIFLEAGEKNASRIARYDLSEDNGNESWESLGDGVDGSVNALAAFGDYLFVGGDFDYAGSNYIKHKFARYNISDDNGNESWSAAYPEKNLGTIRAFERDDNILYISASLNNYPGLIRYNMETFVANYLQVGEEHDFITDLAIIGDYLYMGRSLRNYTVSGGYNSAVDRYSIIDETFERLEDEFNGTITTLETSGQTLYVGGEFKQAGDVPAENIAYSDFTGNKPNWKTFGGKGLNADVRALLVHDNTLYVGGRIFTGVGGILANSLARYDLETQTWSDFGDEFKRGQIYSMALMGDYLYVGGRSFKVGNENLGNIARYNLKEDSGNSSWSSLGFISTTDFGEDIYNPPEVHNMITNGNTLIIGGEFKTLETRNSAVKGSARNSIARFNTITETWSGFGDGLEKKDSDSEYVEGTVRGFAIIGDYLYVGGTFSHRSGNNFDTDNLARYNLKNDNGYSSWSAVSGEDPKIVTDIVARGEELIVAGFFNYQDGAELNVGFYNTVNDNWHIIDGDINGYIYELSLMGDYLFIGGNFSNVGGQNANNIAKLNLDTEEWSALGDGLHGSDQNGHVRAFAAYGDDLYVGGYFTEAGNEPASYLSRWHEENILPVKITLQSPANNGKTNVHPYLIWQSDGAAISYTLMVSETDDFSDPVIHRTNLDASSYQITENLKAGQTYFWRIRGTNDNGTGQWSNTWNFTTQSASTPPPVKVVLQSPANNSQHIPLKPLLDWNEATYAEQYILRLSESTDFSDPLIRQENIDQTSFQLTSNLKTDQTYYWQVRGTNSDGNGPWSLVWSFTTTSASTPLPGKIVLQSPENASHDIPLQPQLSWNADDESDSYELVLSENSDFTAPIIHQPDLDGTTFQPTENLDYSTTYYWQVRGVNDTGNGEWSQTWAFTTIALPGQVSLLSPDNNGTDIPIRPELTWTSTDADETENYELLLSENPDFSNPVVHQTNLEETTLNVSEDLDYSTTYYWRVRGVNSNGSGPWSNTWNFTTILPPIPAQVNLISPADHINDIPLLPELVWEPAGQTENYELIVSTEPDLSNPVLHQTDLHQTTFQLSEELVYSQIYYWQVRGVNMYGDGSWSEIWSFTTIAPTEIALDPNWPNPFSKASAGTTIRYRLPTENNVRLEIYNISGRRVAVLVNNIKPAGEHSIQFNGSGLADGVYFYRLITDDKLVTRKMLMLK